jgi:isoleucyl-tRNA synthetase
VDSLSNWYVRRSRPRFWATEATQDKTDAYWTLYECLLTLARLAAPFTPFFTEATWRNLAKPLPGAFESVHLAEYPTADAARIDRALIDEMAITRQAVNLGLSARRVSNIKVRQPLASCEIVLSDPGKRRGLERHLELIREELNIKAIAFSDDPQQYVTYEVKPNFKVLGPKLGKKVKALGAVLQKINGGALYAQLQQGAAKLEVEGEAFEFTAEELDVRLTPREGFAAAQGRDMVVVIRTEITDALRREGWARDVVRAIQDVRKEKRLAYDARIAVVVFSTHAPFREAVQEFGEYLRSETLADTLDLREGGCTPEEAQQSTSLDEFQFFARVTPL